jgi:ankyrin repeat protein/WD40 repeat protein/TPR repeat protein
MMTGGALLRRYPGAAPFSDSALHRKLFFGRSKDAKNLVDTILADALVVLYAKSGTGKTSLVNVEVKERLRAEGYAPLVVRVDKRDLGPLKTVFDGIRQAAADQGFEHQPGSQISLWHYFKTTELWRDDLLLKPVLIIDQFEELFTLHGPEAREAMIKQLASLLRGPAPPVPEGAMTPELDALTETMPAVKVVLSMREDFLANLEELSRALPNILTTRYRLGPLGREQARQAIDEPATVADETLSTPQFAFEPGVVEKVLDFLASRSSSIDGGEIEPFQIQVVCQHVEELVRSRAAKSPGQKISISFNDLGGEEGLRRTILEFYERQLNALPRRLRRRVERLCEQGLASREGRRLSQEQNEIQRRFRIDETLLGLLVQSRLLRSEPRLGGHHYELSHDTLLFPVLRARDSHARRRRLQFAGAVLLVALVPMIYIAIDQYHKHFLRTQAELLQQYDQAPESDSEGRLMLALGAVGAGMRAGAPDPRAVEILATADQREATTVTTLPAEVSVAVLSPSGHSLATATKTGRVELRDPAGKSWRVLEPGPWAEVSQLAFSADGTRIAAAAGSTIRVWDVTGKKVSDVAIPASDTDKPTPTALAFDPGSDALFVATSAGGWARIDGAAIAKSAMPTGLSQAPVLARLTIARDGQTVYGLSPRGVAYAWSATGTYYVELPIDGGVDVWAASADGSRIAAIVGDHVRLIQASGRARDLSLTESKSATSASRARSDSPLPTSLAFSPDGDSLAVGLADGGALIFALTGTDSKIRQRLLPQGYSEPEAEAIAWSKSGKTVAILHSEIDYSSRYDSLRYDPSRRYGGGLSSLRYDAHVSFFTLGAAAPQAEQTAPDQPAVRAPAAVPRPTTTGRPSDVTGKDSPRFTTERAIESFWLVDDRTGYVRIGDGKIQRVSLDRDVAEVVGGSKAMVSFSCDPSTAFLVQTTAAAGAPGLLAMNTTGSTTNAKWRWAAGASGGQSQLLRASMCNAAAGFYAVTLADGRPHLWKATVTGGQLDEVPIEKGIWAYPSVVTAFAQADRFVLVGTTGLIQTVSLEGTLAPAAGVEDRPILPSLIFDSDDRLLSWTFTGPPSRRPFSEFATSNPLFGGSPSTVSISWIDRNPRGVWTVANADTPGRFVGVDQRGDVHLLDDSGSDLIERQVWNTALSNVEQIVGTTRGSEILALSKNAQGAYAVAHVQAPPLSPVVVGDDRIAVGAHGRLVSTLSSGGNVWGLLDPKLEEDLSRFSRLPGPCTPSAIAASPVSDEMIIGCVEGLLRKRAGSGAPLPDPADAFEADRKDCGPDAVLPDTRRSKITAIAYEPAGKFFTAATGGRLAVWSADGAVVAKTELPDEVITALAFGAGDVVAAGLDSGKIMLWRLAGTNLAPVPALGGFGAMGDDIPSSLDFSPDGHRLLAGFEGGTIRLFDWSAKSTLKEITMHSRKTKESIVIVNVTFFADGRRFAAGSSEGEFQVWSDLGEPQTPIIGVGDSKGEPVSVATLPDGHLITSVGAPLEMSPAVSLNEWIDHACNRLRHSNRFLASTDGPSDAARETCTRYAATGASSDRDALLREAATAGHISVVESALEGGVKPNAKDAAGQTPLMQALKSGHQDIALVLLSHGADIRAGDETKQTALHYAARGDAWRVVPQLLSSGLAVDEPDMSGRTPLMVAARYSNTRVMHALLNAHASVNAVDDFGRTALMYAAEVNQTAALAILLKAGAELDVRERLGLTFGRTALQVAEFSGATVGAEALRSGASPKVVTSGDNSFIRFPAGFLATTPAQRESAAGLAAWTAGTMNKDAAVALLGTLESRAAAGEGRDLVLLGLARAVGLGGKSDWTDAREKFKLAGQRGDPLGDSLYGMLLKEGMGGPQDVKGGDAAVQRALERAEPFASWQMATSAPGSTEAEQTKASERMLSPVQDKGYGPVWNLLALLEIGRTDFNEALATERCEARVKQNADRAIELGDPMAIRNLTERLWTLRVPTVSLDRAVDQMVQMRQNLVLVSNPAVRPEARIAFLAGLAYEHGAGVAQDHKAAMKWFVKASEWGDSSANRELGRIYDLGLGETASLPAALRYYRLAAAAGDGYARTRLRSLAYGF